MNKQILKSLLIIACAALASFTLASLQPKKPTVFLIGDSTVKNGSGKGADNLWGWGSFLADHFDTTKISIRNYALGGRSSRTFISGGNWDAVLKQLRKGDYVIMQFGHNDSGPLDDSARARGTIRGIGDESKEVYNPILKKKEVVYTYGYYMRKFVEETRSKEALPVICSPIPRCNFKDGKIEPDIYGTWAEEIATNAKVPFIRLNSMIIEKYTSMGEEQVTKLFPKDHTHTNLEGAKINAGIVAEGIRSLKKCQLRKFLLSK
jgi:rhamnogalacturonan acetylesterase